MWAILIHPGELNCHRNCDDQIQNRKRNGLLGMYLTVRKKILNIPFSQKHSSININRHFPLALGVSMVVLSQLSTSGSGSRRCFWACVHLPLPFPSSAVHTISQGWDSWLQPDPPDPICHMLPSRPSSAWNPSPERRWSPFSFFASVYAFEWHIHSLYVQLTLKHGFIVFLKIFFYLCAETWKLIICHKISAFNT